MPTSQLGRTVPEMWEAWTAPRHPKELFVFCIPYGGGSKNDMHYWRKSGGKTLTESARKFKADIGLMALAAARDVTFKPGKVWLSIFVELPEKSKADAINLLDLIADGVQDGIGINDKNFAVWRLDYATVKFEPQVYVAVGQF